MGKSSEGVPNWARDYVASKRTRRQPAPKRCDLSAGKGRLTNRCTNRPVWKVALLNVAAVSEEYYSCDACLTAMVRWVIGDSKFSATVRRL